MSDPSDLRDVSDFRMPALGADMEKGTMLQWYVKPGDEVHRGQVIAEVDTAKSAIEIEVFENGLVDEIVVPVGAEVPVGTVLAHLRPGTTRESRPVAATTPNTAVPEAPAQAPTTASPSLRKLADRLHVDLDTVVGSGRNGKITRADIVKATLPKPTPVRGQRLARALPRPAANGTCAPPRWPAAAQPTLAWTWHNSPGQDPAAPLRLPTSRPRWATVATPAQPAKPVSHSAAQPWIGKPLCARRSAASSPGPSGRSRTITSRRQSTSSPP